MMKTRLLIIPVVAALLAIGAEPRPLPPRLDGSELMRTKLDKAQAVLDGITTADFAKIYRNARQLHAYSQSSAWRGSDRSTDYGGLTLAFRRTAGELSQAARDKNLDRATLAYFQLTLSCVNCHKFMRDTP